MIPKLYAAAFISASLLLSCAGNNNNDYIDKSLIPPAAENKTVQTTDNASTAAQPINTQPNNITGSATIPASNEVNVISNTNSVKINPLTANVKLNPAHGQPGHRCDIAVGAPLDSKPVQINTQQPTTITTTPQPVAQTTAPGMNPPHGQPNHRCDIAVGAPLNSPVTQAATPVQTTVPPVTVDPAVVKPPKPDSLKNQ
ncbi:MAG: hypothetical protein ABI666_12370 [Ferruginibacter sp.]